MSLPTRGVISDFPSYNWVFGCSAVSAAMIAGYHDRTGYPNLYTGITNGGVMPLSDTVWPRWTDSAGDNHASNPLVATRSGVDGYDGRGSIENYWVSSGSAAPDPYLTNVWEQHAWGTAIGDYMKTSQSAYGKPDGATSFWNYTGSSTKLTCATMETTSAGGGMMISDVDGTYGRKRFYEDRGYTVADCYNQRTVNQVTGGFSLADFQKEIDDGHPVLLNLEGHSIVGYAYSGSTIFIRDTWSSEPNNTYTMTWGTNPSYAGRALLSVSVVRLAPLPTIPPPTAPPAPPTDLSASQGTCIRAVHISWEAPVGATSYQVFRNEIDSTVNAIELSSSTIFNPFEDCSAEPEKEFFYWVKACNDLGCSDYSASCAGWRQEGQPVFLPLITR